MIDFVVWMVDNENKIRPIECEYENNKVEFILNSSNKFVIGNFPFEDVNNDSWYYQSVAEMNAIGAMNGVSTDEFAPEENTTRGMVVTVLFRLAEDKSTTNIESVFEDITSGAYYEDAVNWAKDIGIVKGITENLYAPEQFITREQMVAILYRNAILNGKVKETEYSNLSNFTDANDISEYAMDAINWAVTSGVVEGNTDGTINPREKQQEL